MASRGTIHEDPSSTRDRPGVLGLPFHVSQLALIALAGVLAAGVGGLIAVLGGHDFESRSTLLIDQPGAIAAGEGDAALVKLEHLRFKYAPLLNTSVLTEPTAQKMGMKPAEVARSVRATPRGGSLLVDVFGRADNPADARKLADTAATELATFASSEQATNGIPQPKQFVLTSVDPARGGARIGADIGRVLTIALVAGLLAAIAAAVVLYTLGVGAKP